MSFIAGKYTCTWNSLALGQTEAGFNVTHQRFVQQIKGDNYGETVQDQINLGADMQLDCTLLEFNAAALPTILWPISGTIYDMGVIGVLDSGKWKSLVLTAVAGTPAAAAPATATFAQSILKENFPVRILYASRLRTVPLQMRLFPSSAVFGTIT